MYMCNIINVMVNDIERHNFWTSEMDSYLKAHNEWKPIIEPLKINGNEAVNKLRALHDHLEILKNNSLGVPKKFFGDK